MAMPTLAEGDTAGAITAVLSNADGVQDLTGATVVLHLKKRSTGATLTAACTVTAAASGAISIPGSVRTAWLAGVYDVEFVVTYADSSVDIFPSVAADTFTLRPRAT